MTQPQPSPQLSPQPSPQSTPRSKPAPAAPFRPQAPATVSAVLRDYIQAAATGDRSAIYYLFAVVFASARAAVRCLMEHYNAHPRQRTFDAYARLKYCATRLNAIFYTLHHAPERFLTPAQLRALTRCRAVLAHIWRQPVDFSPLTPYLTSPENCPPPPRSLSSAGILPASEAPLDAPRSALRTSSSPANPLLLRAPGRVLASVLLQLAAIYGLSSTPAPTPRPAPAASTSPAAPEVATCASAANCAPYPPESDPSVPQSEFLPPHLPIHPPP